MWLIRTGKKCGYIFIDTIHVDRHMKELSMDENKTKQGADNRYQISRHF